MTLDHPKPRAWSIDQTLACIREMAHPLEPEPVPLAQAGDRVLREAVQADVDQPPFDRSAVDGYAIRLEDAATVFHCVDRLRAGDWRPRSLQPGETVSIATGAALPSTGLQVVMQEDVSVEGDRVTVRVRDPDRNIRFRGDDARAGQVLVESGTWLSPGTLALLASAGCARPAVTRLPRVVHLVSGNEIVPCSQTPGAGQIRDSNSVLVRAFLRAWNIEPVQLHAPEHPDALRSALASAQVNPEQVDLLLISGGVSVGDHDFTMTWLTDLGYALHIRRTTARPGKPLTFGAHGTRLAFGLPGNPLAHFTCLNVYVRQALRRLLGAAETSLFATTGLAHDLPDPADPSSVAQETPRPNRIKAPDSRLQLSETPQQLGAHEPANTASADPPAREVLWPARLEDDPDGARLTLLPWRSSGDLTALARANALARIQLTGQPLARGNPVVFLSTSRTP